MPMVADYIIDYPEEFYKACGVEILYDKEILHPDETGNIQEGSVIFVKTDFIINEEFQTHWLDKISVPFILISGASDFQIGKDGQNPESYKKILENEYLMCWFATNIPTEANEKIKPLPIGFGEPNRLVSNQLTLKKSRKNKKPFEEKIDRLLIPWHDQSTNPDRNKIINNLKRKEYIDIMQGKVSIEPYLSLIGDYKFTICIQGNGNDTHRVYESLLMGSVPIMLNSSGKYLFEKYNLPGYFIDNWDELTEEKFEEILNIDYDFSQVEKALQVKTYANEIKEIK